MSAPGTTPGPWVAVNHDVEGERYIGDSGVRFWNVLRDIGPYRGDVCAVHSAQHIGGITLAERNANAALIAASPALYEALEELVKWKLSGPEPSRLWDAARAALALARGETA